MLWLLRSRPVGAGLLLRSYAASSAQAIVLRPYQEGCLVACTDALQSGASRIGVSLPTGSGKTTVFISLLSRMTPPSVSPKATRSLIVVNGIELARQSAQQASRMRPDWTVEIEQGMTKATGLADVTIATYQTLLRPDRLAKFQGSYLKAIIIDEAHHAAAPSYRRIMAHFDADIKHPDVGFEPPVLPHKVPIIGFSATFSRHDGLALGSVFDRIVYHRGFLEMIKEQWLCNVRFTSVQASLDLANVTLSGRTGDFNATSLAHVINTDTVNRLVVQSWLDRAATRRSTLVFCVNLAHVRELTRTFRDAGIDARYLYSGTPAAERKALVDSFKAGQFPVLVNCAILTEGADIPNIDCVVVARPTRSRNVFAQMIGRGMRLSPDTGKEDCHIIDFVDSTDRVAGVVCTPTLFGLDPSEMVDDETTESLEERSAAMEMMGGSDTKDHIPDPKSITYVDHENPFSLVDHASGAPHISKLSSHAWVGCGGDVYVLECLGKGHIRIEPLKGENGARESHFQAHFTPTMVDKGTAHTLKIPMFARNRKVLTAETLSDAIRGCDTYATTKVVFGPHALGLLRTARWRKHPATESQKQFVAKRWGMRGHPIESDGPPSSDKAKSPQDQIANMTKGQAANIITRFKHGAHKRYEKKIQVERKAAIAASKERLRKARETVRVGVLEA
ncbi:hypothetical protein JAAARDRAFT_120193 [Jaapia argillacea MUCL 33604]|uniref:P-loop containing nucleoside triphosphate hydrolase protein n=1 Tax=Jaapia argillacea MUCL 33604 TaxID=933084 RepID=A0A067QLM2_9AGAM|nr:hypothetical protein JAAARDRAFT_120193 [Jaapia argillacea MUCL 33604]